MAALPLIQAALAVVAATAAALLLLAAVWWQPRLAAALSRGQRPAAVRVARGLLLALSWVAAPMLLVVMHAVGVSVRPGPLIVGWVVMVVLAAVRLVDLSSRLATERAERDSSQRFRGAFEQAMVGMALVETQGQARGTLAEVNDTLCRIFGTGPAELVGRPFEALVGVRAEPGGDDAFGSGPAPERRAQDRPLAGVLDRLAEQPRIQLPSEVPLATADGRSAWGVVSISWTEGAGRRFAVLQIEDVTERRQARDQLTYLALQDPLTGLANRRQLVDRLTAAAARAQRSATVVSVVLVDLDRFEGVNQRFGPESGDEVLVEAGARLRAVTRPGDTVARLAGDHFAVLLDGLSSEADAVTVADRVRTALSRPYQLRGAEVTITAGIGLATTGCEARRDVRSVTSSQALLADAQLALARAKITGHGRAVVFDATLAAQAHERAGLEDDLRAALSGSGLRVAYQPIVALGPSQARPVVGWEALLRWDRPCGEDPAQTRELLPGDFLAVAEQSGLIVPIGHRALEIALAAVSVLATVGEAAAPLVMCVNFSARQLARSDAAARILRAIETASVAPDAVCLEVTETTLVGGGDDVLGALRRVRAQGVRVALDDFGTGQTALSHLRQLPLDAIKIDVSLVAALERGRSDADVLAGVVQLAVAVGLDVVAEGVESAATDLLLAELHVHRAQGRHYGMASAAPWPAGEPRFAPMGAPRRSASAAPGH